MFERIVLENNLRIILAPQPESLAATLLTLVEAGSKYENKKISGLSHFLEHMCFKGTKKRPKSIDIAAELEGIGAVSNAFTSHEFTGYFAKARARHFDEILDVVSDVYLNPIFDSAEMEKEKGVIFEEMNMYEDDLPRKASELFMRVLYGDQPAGWDIAGTKETVGALSRDDFLKYRGEHYVAGATVVVAAGALKENVLEKIKEKFSSVSVSEKAGKEKVVERQESPRVALKSRESGQTHFVLGFRAFPLFDERRWALEVLSNILGGGISSRLFQRVREGMGAAYYVYADADLFTDHGILAAAGGVDTKRAESVVSAALEEFSQLSREKVSDEELRRAKEHLAGTLALRLETSDRLASFYGTQEILEKRILTAEETVSKIEAVTKEEILSVAGDVVKNEALNLALIGPFKDEGEFAKMLKV